MVVWAWIGKAGGQEGRQEEDAGWGVAGRHAQYTPICTPLPTDTHAGTQHVHSKRS